MLYHSQSAQSSTTRGPFEFAVLLPQNLALIISDLGRRVFLKNSVFSHSNVIGVVKSVNG